MMGRLKVPNTGRNLTLHGTCIPFSASPCSEPNKGMPFFQVGSSEVYALSQVVKRMLKMDALEAVMDVTLGIFGCLSLVEKATDCWRPVIELTPLDKFVQQTKLKTETVASILFSFRGDNFLAYLNLKDAFFIHQALRNCFLLVLEKVVWHFKALLETVSYFPYVTCVFIPVSVWLFRGVILLFATFATASLFLRPSLVWFNAEINFFSSYLDLDLHKQLGEVRFHPKQRKNSI